MKIILINGKKRSGKDFVAAAIKNEFNKHNKTAEIMSFADPIKDIIAETLKITIQDLELYKNNPTEYMIELQKYPSSVMESPSALNHIDFRVILQRFGTESMKKWFGEEVWVNLLLSRAESLDVDYVLVPDFRFLCEAVSKETICVHNDDYSNANDAHRSENELNEFNFKYTINNTGYRDISKDIEDLVLKIL